MGRLAVWVNTHKSMCVWGGGGGNKDRPEIYALFLIILYEYS